jgi:hypothetical protein
MSGAKYFNVTLTWPPTNNRVSPITSIKLECLAAKDKQDAKGKAKVLVPAPEMIVTEVYEL